MASRHYTGRMLTHEPTHDSSARHFLKAKKIIASCQARTKTYVASDIQTSALPLCTPELSISAAPSHF